MQLPEYESVHLVRSPLQLVASQVTFEEVAFEVAHRQAREVQKSLGGGWTTLQSAPQLRTTLTPGGALNDKQRQAYRLVTRDENWSLVINPDSVILETRKYDGWDDMSQKLYAALVAVVQVFDPAQALRVGLRYVDQVAMPEGHHSWDGLIRPSLLGLASDSAFSGSVLGVEQRHLIEIDEEIRCFFRHGAQFQDQEESSSANYLLDFDVSREGSYDFDLSSLKSVVERLHSAAGSLFRLSIEDKLFEWLRGNVSE